MKWVLLALGTLCSLGILAWLAVTQPTLTGNSRSCEVMDVDPGSLRAHVERIADPRTPRDYVHPENLERVAAHVREEFERAGARVSDQPFQVGGIVYRNIIAGFGPVIGPRIVVGAHYDTWGAHPGADDNASGVAGLLELAHSLGRELPPVMVELVAYSLEEPPFFRTPEMGSALHARSLRRQGVRVRAMISLEMIGYFTDAQSSQRFPFGLLKLFYPQTGNFIAVVGKLGQGELVRTIKRAMRSVTPLPVHSINAPRSIPGIDFSDHLNYWAMGFPAVMITDTAFYRNDLYHTEADTAESLDYARMAHVVEGLHCAVHTLALET